MNQIKEETSQRMSKSIDSLKSQFNKIRTGRANPSILESVTVDYYGTPTPINQTSNISVEEGRTLTISPLAKIFYQRLREQSLHLILGLIQVQVVILFV